MANTDMSDSSGSDAPSHGPVLPNTPMPGSRSIVAALVGIGALIVVLASFALTQSPEPELGRSPVSVNIEPSAAHAVPANNDDDHDDTEPLLPNPTPAAPAPPPNTGVPEPGPPAEPAAPIPPPPAISEFDDDGPDDDLEELDDDLDDDDLDDD